MVVNSIQAQCLARFAGGGTGGAVDECAVIVANAVYRGSAAGLVKFPMGNGP